VFYSVIETRDFSLFNQSAQALLKGYFINIISTDEDPGLRIESFAVINLRGVSTNKTIIDLKLLSISQNSSWYHVFVIYRFLEYIHND
jgi:hypothetical protein